jgi:hypothetical protein
MILKVVTYFGQPCAIACDARCEKAWGVSRRPRIYLSDAADDWAFRSDSELPAAPAHPGTSAGSDVKPREPGERLNRWCAQECERSVVMRVGDELTRLPDFSGRVRNRRVAVEPVSRH